MNESKYRLQEKNSRKREEELVRYLLSGGHSYEEVLSHLSSEGFEITKPSLKKDKERLNQLGFSIYSRKGVLYLDSSNLPDRITPTRDAELDIISRQLAVLLLLGENGGLSYGRLLEILSDGFHMDWANEYILRTNILRPLKEEKLVTYDKKCQKYYSVFPGSMFGLPAEESVLFKLLNKNTALPQNVYDGILDCLLSDSFLFDEKKRTDLFRISKYMEQLRYIRYTSTVLSFSYRTNQGKIKEIPNFYIGIIAYSVERDIVYLIGRTTLSKGKASYQMIAASHILWETLAVSKNQSLFEKNSLDESYLESLRCEFSQMKDEMFVVSCDKPQEVQIEIDYSPEREKDFRLLALKRQNTASLSEEDNKMIYRDTIRGLGDFARFLRRYGNHVRDISKKPENTLRKQLLETANQALLRYREKGANV